MTGILLIDKPSGPTSHDVVARLRRATGERSIGHAGTLDPRATGLLVMLLGKGTRLASLLTGHDKTYEATVRFGWSTTTDDADGPRLEPASGGLCGPAPTPEALDAALEAFRGTYDQMPPQFSAKRVDGRKAYDLARRDQRVALKPSTVTVKHLALVECGGDLAHLRLTVSAGFYVRSLARDLGAQLECGAHLEALRRTASGYFALPGTELDSPVTAYPVTALDEAERLGPGLADRLVSLADALPDLPAVRLSDVGLTKVRHGNPVGPQLVEGAWVPASAQPGRIRLLDGSGSLVALADLRGGLLHPAVVLG